MRQSRFTFALFCLLAAPHVSRAESEPAGGAHKPSAVAEDLCEAFADKAAEAKLARHRAELLSVKSDVEQQLVKLAEKTKELETWLAKRDQIRKTVSEGLVKMYANVESEVAAQQLQKLNPQLASEVLLRLSPKLSGEIVTAMEVEFASKVVKTMLADAAKVKSKSETQ